MDEVGTPGEGTRRGMAGAIMRLPRILFPRIAPMNRGGDGSSPPRFMGAMRGKRIRGSLIMDEMGMPGALTRRGVAGP